MNTEALGRSKLLNLIFRPAGAVMESRLRYWLTDPVKVVEAAGIASGQTVLEVGSGTGFFTLPTARAIARSGLFTRLGKQNGVYTYRHQANNR